MFLVVLLPFTYCLATQPNETQSDHSTSPPPHQQEFIWIPPTKASTPPGPLQNEFIWLPPTKPTLWPKYHHLPFYRKPRRPPPQFFPKYFPEHFNWIPSRTPSFPHLHLHHPRHHQPRLTEVQKLLNVPFEREDDEVKTPSETIDLDSQVLSSMEKLTSEKLQTKVEILKSIEMEYDPVLKRFVQKRSEVIVQPKHKRSGGGDVGLLTHHTHQNLQDVFKKFEKEQTNQALVMRDKKNFQTGRFKFKQDLKIGPGSDNSTKNLLCDVKTSGSKPNFNSFDRFVRNVKDSGFYSEPGLDNNSISVYVDDPNFFSFLHGNWSKGGIPIMLTAMSPNSSKNCVSC